MGGWVCFLICLMGLSGRVEDRDWCTDDLV